MADRRPADVVIGGRENPYLRRWWIIPRNSFFNVYYHEFRRSDDDRALHDHEYINLSWLLEGSYVEWQPHPLEDAYEQRVRKGGAFVVRRPTSLHRIQLNRDTAGNEVPTRTLFITGPRVRTWGFCLPDGKWMDWRSYLAKFGERE